MSMTSSRPYLIRAIYEWINDNHLTPYVIVDIAVEGVVAPMEYAENGRLVLNVSPTAVKGLCMSNESVTFGARFGSRAMEVHLPVPSVLAIYAKENGQGMIFSELPDGGGGGGGTEGTPSRGGAHSAGRPALRVVK
jgi:stringent starvation protein B